MYLKGVKVRKSRAIGFRDGNPEIDKDIHGNPIERNYVAFVRISDCEYKIKDDVRYYDPSTAKCIPVGYGATYYGYGKRKKINERRKIEDKYYSSYYKTPFYIVYEGSVYVGSVYKGIEE